VADIITASHMSLLYIELTEKHVNILVERQSNATHAIAKCVT